MRHLGDVADDRLTGDVLAHGKGQAAARIRERRGGDALADVDRVDRLVRHLDADCDLVRNGRDAHVRRSERQRDIIRQGGDARKLDAARDGQFEPRHRRAAHDADDLRVDIERLERIEQAFGIFLKLSLRARIGGAFALRQQFNRRIVIDRHRRFLALIHFVIQCSLLIFAHLLRLFRLAFRDGRFHRFFLRRVFHQIENAHLLACGLLLQGTQVSVRCHGLAAMPAAGCCLRILARLVLARRLSIQRDIDIRLTAGCAALLALVRVYRRSLMDVGQLGGRFVALALRLVLIFIFGRPEHLDQRLRCDMQSRQKRRNRQQEKHQQCADRGQRPLEDNIQPAGQQAAGIQLHAGLQQAGQRFHGEIVFICAGERMDDAADQHRQHRDAHTAQTHRSLIPRKQQPCQRQQRKWQYIAAHADHRADAAVNPGKQDAVYRQNRQQAQQAEHGPDRAPRGAGHHRLGLGRPTGSLLAARCRFRRLFRCGFSCSQRK